MLQFVVNGLITGVLYSLMAIGFALVYNTTRVFHIAAVGIYVFAAYMFYLFAMVFSLPVLLAALVAILLAMGLSLSTDVVVYRPLEKRNASVNVAMIASIGMMTVIINLLAMFFGNGTKFINKTLSFPPQVLQLVLGGVTIAVFFVFIAVSKWGMRFRALSADAVLYKTLGFNLSRTRTMAFLMSGGFIAVGSCLNVYDVGLDPIMGMNVFVNALVAMIIGGVGRFGTCVLGGIALGVLQGLTVFFFPPHWQNVVTFVVLLVFLFLRPQGIAGYKQRTV